MIGRTYDFKITDVNESVTFMGMITNAALRETGKWTTSSTANSLVLRYSGVEGSNSGSNVRRLALRATVFINHRGSNTQRSLVFV